MITIKNDLKSKRNLGLVFRFNITMVTGTSRYLNVNQIMFINKVIDYIEQNGYVENLAELTKPPFDKPQSFIKLFDTDKQKKFVQIINEVKDNATKVIS